MSRKKRMLKALTRQRAGEPAQYAGYILEGFNDSQLEAQYAGYILEGFNDSQLDAVRRFISSFKREKKTDEKAELRADRVKLQGEIEHLMHENLELRKHLYHAGETLLDAGERAEAKRTDIEALAQRLAKVEDRLAEDAITLNRHAKQAGADRQALSHRIDLVCDIIGARISGLEERLNANVENVTFDRKRVDLIITDDLPAIAEALGEIRRLTLTPSVPFPTGAGTTVEDAIAQVEEPGAESDTSPPRRGDRVRLEGARTAYTRTLLADGWFDVIGCSPRDPVFQIARPDGDLRSVPWVRNDDPGLKEVRRGAANLPE